MKDGSRFIIPKKYPKDPSLTITIGNSQPWGWPYEVRVNGRMVLSGDFGKPSDDTREYMAATLALFLENRHEVPELEDETARLGEWGHDIQNPEEGA